MHVLYRVSRQSCRKHAPRKGRIKYEWQSLEGVFLPFKPRKTEPQKSISLAKNMKLNTTYKKKIPVAFYTRVVAQTLFVTFCELIWGLDSASYFSSNIIPNLEKTQKKNEDLQICFQTGDVVQAPLFFFFWWKCTVTFFLNLYAALMMKCGKTKATPKIDLNMTQHTLLRFAYVSPAPALHRWHYWAKHCGKENGNISCGRFVRL